MRFRIKNIVMFSFVISLVTPLFCYAFQQTEKRWITHEIPEVKITDHEFWKTIDSLTIQGRMITPILGKYLKIKFVNIEETSEWRESGDYINVHLINELSRYGWGIPEAYFEKLGFTILFYGDWPFEFYEPTGKYKSFQYPMPIPKMNEYENKDSVFIREEIMFDIGGEEWWIKFNDKNHLEPIIYPYQYQ